MPEPTTTGMAEKGHGLLCPLCTINLVMSERQGIEIDYCPKCRGVWLDRGELDKIIERNVAEDDQPQTGRARAQTAPRNTSGDYADNHRRDYSDHDRHSGGHGRRHGSFLSRLFD